MVNRDMSQRFPEKNNHPGPVLMEVKNLTGKYEPTCHDVSFELHKGEVLGVAGLVGSRRTELLNTIFGYYTRGSGEIIVNGKPVENKVPAEATRNGFALLTEERRATGIFPPDEHQLQLHHRQSAPLRKAAALLRQDGQGYEVGRRFHARQGRRARRRTSVRCPAATSRRSSSAAGF